MISSYAVRVQSFVVNCRSSIDSLRTTTPLIRQRFQKRHTQRGDRARHLSAKWKNLRSLLKHASRKAGQRSRATSASGPWEKKRKKRSWTEQLATLDNMEKARKRTCVQRATAESDKTLRDGQAYSETFATPPRKPEGLQTLTKRIEGTRHCKEERRRHPSLDNRREHSRVRSWLST